MQTPDCGLWQCYLSNFHIPVYLVYKCTCTLKIWRLRKFISYFSEQDNENWCYEMSSTNWMLLMITLTSFFLKLKWLYSHLNSYRYFDIIPLSITRYDRCNIKEELANSILKQQIKKSFFILHKRMPLFMYLTPRESEWHNLVGENLSKWLSPYMTLAIQDTSSTPRDVSCS